VHSLDAYKGKSRHVLEFVKRALTVEMRGLLFGKREDGWSKITAAIFRDAGNSLPRSHYIVLTKREASAIW